MRPGATITLVIAKAPPVTAPPTTEPARRHRPIATRPIPATAFLRHRIWIAPTSATASTSIISTATRIAWMLMGTGLAATAGDDKCACDYAASDGSRGRYGANLS